MSYSQVLNGEGFTEPVPEQSQRHQETPMFFTTESAPRITHPAKNVLKSIPAINYADQSILTVKSFSNEQNKIENQDRDAGSSNNSHNKDKNWDMIEKQS